MRRRTKRIKYKRLTQHQQIGAGFGAFLKIVPQLLRRLGRGVRSGVRRSPGLFRKVATKKNLKRAAKAGAVAAATGAVSGGASHLVNKLLDRG